MLDLIRIRLDLNQHSKIHPVHLPGVGDKDLILGVAGHVPGIVELPVLLASLPELVDENA
jgi:hypothetical protein